MRLFRESGEEFKEGMFIIFVYDIASRKRLPKVLKKSRAYLNWVQNSVFEGELTNAQFEVFKEDLLKIIDKDYDSLIFYTFRRKVYTERQCYGIEKSNIGNIL